MFYGSDEVYSSSTDRLLIVRPAHGRWLATCRPTLSCTAPTLVNGTLGYFSGFEDTRVGLIPSFVVLKPNLTLLTISDIVLYW